ncbi:MAG: hypothetical protein O3A87_10675 [Verrucomicrobia bacterium]|nr:hypothetical protein [Verrucomicrobiota bacterium]MDA1006924.1 hypothetical protein [Verrucomicrobiota bacterium]
MDPAEVICSLGFVGFLACTALSLIWGDLNVAFACLFLGMTSAILLLHNSSRNQAAKDDVRDLVDNEENRRLRKIYGKARYDFLSSNASLYYHGTAHLGVSAGALLGILGAGSIPFHLAKAASSKLINRGRRHDSRTAKELESLDQRPPVLYLRSFADERFLADPKGAWNLEQIIVESGSLLGPVLAIGRPGEGLPPLGAARDYVSDDEWQGHAVRWMESTTAILLVAGPTRGLAWEAARLESSGFLPKSIFVIPPLSTEDVLSCWQEFCRKIADLSPVLAQKLQHIDPSCTNAIVFSNEEAPCTLNTSGRDVKSYEVALTYALGMIREKALKTSDLSVEHRPVPPRGRSSFRLVANLATLFVILGLLRILAYGIWEHPHQWKGNLRASFRETDYEEAAMLAHKNRVEYERFAALAQAESENPALWEKARQEHEDIRRTLSERFSSSELSYLKWSAPYPSPEERMLQAERLREPPVSIARSPVGSPSRKGWQDGMSNPDAPYVQGYSKGLARYEMTIKQSPGLRLDERGAAEHYAHEVAKEAGTMSATLFPDSNTDAAAFARGYSRGACSIEILHAFFESGDWRKY